MDYYNYDGCVCVLRELPEESTEEQVVCPADMMVCIVPCM